MPDQRQALHYCRLFRAVAYQRSVSLLQSAQRRAQCALSSGRYSGQRNADRCCRTRSCRDYPRYQELEKSGTLLPSTIPEIQLGRGEIEKQITERTRQKISDFGIELLDERFKRSKYNPAVAEKIIERMSSERHQIAARFRSEGRGEAANINGQKESDVASISSTATRNASETEGKADAEAASIYAAAFNPPDAQEFYSFLRSLDVMRAAFEKDTTAVISTNSDLGRLLKSMAEAVAL